MKQSDLDQLGAHAARHLLATNHVSVRVIPGTGAHVLNFESEHARGTVTLGRGVDLPAACQDALAMLDDKSPEDVPVQALHLAALVSIDPVWAYRAFHHLFPAGTRVAEFAESGEDVSDGEPMEEVVQGSFDDDDEIPVPRRRHS